ncbi:ATP-binding protein [Deltaproteobacteria bacterium TL4]
MMPKRIRKKILVVFLFSVIITIIGNLALYFQFRSQKQLTSRIIEKHQPTALAWVKLLNGVNHSVSAQRGWVLFGHEQFRQERLQAWELEIEPMLEQLKKLYADQEFEGERPTEVKKFYDIRLILLELEKRQEEVDLIAHTPQNIPSQELFDTQLRPLMTTMIRNLTLILENTSPNIKSYPSFLKHLVELKGNLWLHQSNLQEYLLQGEELVWKGFRETLIESQRLVLDVDSTQALFEPLQRSHWRQFLKNWKDVVPLFEELRRKRNEDSWNVALYQMRFRSLPLAKNIEDAIRSIVENQSEFAQRNVVRIQKELTVWGNLFLGVTLTISILGYFFSRFLGNQIAEALRELRDTVQKVKEEDFYGHIDITTDDEVGELAHEFQEMLDALNERTKDSSRSRQILDNSPSPVMLVTPSRELEYINPAAQQELKAVADFLPALPEEMLGEHIDFLLDLSPIEYHQLHSPYQLPPTTDITLGNQIIEVTFNPLFDAKDTYLGVVLHWRNVTQERHMVSELETQSLAKQHAVDQLEAQNQRLRDQLQLDQAQAIIAKAINSLDVSAILGDALETLAKTTNSQLGVIYLQGQDEQTLVLKNYYTIDEQVMDAEFYQVQGLPLHIFSTKKPIHIRNPDPAQGKSFHLGVVSSYPKAIVGYPLMFQRKCLGVLLLSSVSEFRGSTISFLENTVPQLAVAIQNALTFQTVQDQQRILEAANVELEIATRSKSEFLANMSHELRTPLNAIIGFAEALSDDDDDDPLTDYQRDRLGRIHQSGQNLLALINSLLDLSKIEAGRMEVANVPFNIKKVVENVLMMLESLVASKSMTLNLHLKTEEFQCQSDPNKIRQILINLLGNSIKFTDEGGAITVTISRENEWIIIAVADTGCGIPKDQHESIFDSFRQVDGSATRNYEGTGLGLALVKSMIQLLGGNITVESELNVGSTFMIQFPAKLADAKVE